MSICSFAALGLLAGLDSASAEPLRASAAHGEALLLLTRNGAAAVRVREGREVAIALPTGAQLEAVNGTPSSWVATGTRPLPRGNGTEVVVVAGDGAQATVLPRPGGRRARERAEPTALLERGGLAGLAWLEGGDRGTYAVRAAAWDGARWDTVRTVAEAGPGSQLALASAVLADGSWLLVWSRFDGQDDEIVWSIRRSSEWSAPQRLHSPNEVPDITPALTASGSGAVAAWSHFDGSDYRLQVARFDGRAWQPEQTVGGAGWVYPDLLAGDAGRVLVRVRQAVSREWAVVELDDDLRLRRLAVGPDAGAATPLLRAADEHGVRVRFTGSAAETVLPWRALP